MCFTPFVPDPKTQQIIGYSCIAVTSLHLLFNMIFIILGIIESLFQEFRLFSSKLKLRKEKKRLSESKEKLKDLRKQRRAYLKSRETSTFEFKVPTKNLRQKINDQIEQQGIEEIQDELIRSEFEEVKHPLPKQKKYRKQKKKLPQKQELKIIKEEIEPIRSESEEEKNEVDSSEDDPRIAIAIQKSLKHMKKTQNQCREQNPPKTVLLQTSNDSIQHVIGKSQKLQKTKLLFCKQIGFDEGQSLNMQLQQSINYTNTTQLTKSLKSQQIAPSISYQKKTASSQAIKLQSVSCNQLEELLDPSSFKKHDLYNSKFQRDNRYEDTAESLFSHNKKGLGYQKDISQSNYNKNNQNNLISRKHIKASTIPNMNQDFPVRYKMNLDSLVQSKSQSPKLPEIELSELAALEAWNVAEGQSSQISVISHNQLPTIHFNELPNFLKENSNNFFVGDALEQLQEIRLDDIEDMYNGKQKYPTSFFNNRSQKSKQVYDHGSQQNKAQNPLEIQSNLQTQNFRKRAEFQ